MEPLLLDDGASTDENSDLTINILANDRAFFGHNGSIVTDSVSSPSYGSVIINSDNTITYHPSQLRLPGDTVVSDTFFYTASYDSGALQYTATVTINIQQTNDEPLVVDSEHIISNEQEFSFHLKAYDEDDDTLTFFVASFEGTGEYTLDPVTGIVTYLQYQDYTGQDFLVYGVRDEDSTSALARVSIITVEGNSISIIEQEEEADSSDYDEADGEEANDLSYDYYDDHYSDDEEEEEEQQSSDDTNSDDESPESPGTGNDANANGTSSNQVPIADAGSNLEVLNGTQVMLDGSGSYDPDGDEITYTWSQAYGTPVTLLDSDGAHPTFAAPDQLTVDIILSFELVVSDGNLTSLPSPVTVAVLAETEVDSEEGAGSACTDAVPITDISASGFEASHPQSHAIDSNLTTQWSQDGIGSWITADMGEEMNICGIDIVWYQGDNRTNNFTVAVSADGTSYSDVYDGESSGTTSSGEIYDFENVTARYVRITVNGNTENDNASITEILVIGSAL